MSVTIKDVARLAGVSVATVSRVLNGSAHVLDETRTRVQAVAGELRFSPNSAARTLSMRRALAVGVVLPDLYGEFFSELLRGMDQAAQRSGYSLLVSSSHHDAPGVETAVAAMRGRVDGLVVMAPEVTRSALVKALPRNLPVVLLNGGSIDDCPNVSAITVDNYGGAAAMTRHLLAMGHRRIGFIAGAAHNTDAQQRERGYRAALRAAGITHDPSLTVRGEFNERSGAEGADALLALSPRPTAIFAANDAMAIGALARLRQKRVNVPKQMAVVGFDDIPIAAYLNPPLSTVRVGIADFGATATEALVGIVASSTARSHRNVLPVELVIRGSCGGKTRNSAGRSSTPNLH